MDGSVDGPCAQRVARCACHTGRGAPFRLLQVLNTRFDRRLWSTVECELGRLFRGPGFNLSARKRVQQPALSSRHIWAMNERKKQNAHLIVRPAAAAAGVQSPRQSKMHGLVAREGKSPMINTAFVRPRLPSQPRYGSRAGGRSAASYGGVGTPRGMPSRGTARSTVESARSSQRAY